MGGPWGHLSAPVLILWCRVTLRDPAMDRCVALQIAHILVVLGMILLSWRRAHS